MGWIKGKYPRLVSVQATGCAPIVKAWEAKQAESEFWENAETLAFGITVPKALGDFLVLDAIYKTDGCAVAVNDSDILDAAERIAATEGLYICPEGASTLAAAEKLAQDGWITPDDKVLLLNTGSGLKYPDIVKKLPKMLKKGDAIPNLA